MGCGTKGNGRRGIMRGDYAHTHRWAHVCACKNLSPNQCLCGKDEIRLTSMHTFYAPLGRGGGIARGGRAGGAGASSKEEWWWEHSQSDEEDVGPRCVFLYMSLRARVSTYHYCDSIVAR